MKDKSAQHEYSLEQFIEIGVSIEFICLDSVTPIEDEVLKTEQVDHLQCCLDKLNSEERQIIYGIFFEEKRQRELAQRLQISASAVGYRKHKILKVLYQEMRSYTK